MDTIELVDDRLRLHPWKPDDAPALLEAVRSSVGTVGRWLPWCRADYDLGDAADWIARCRAGWSASDHFAFALFDKVSGELIGSAGLSQHDRVHRRANLGYWVRQSRQREGLATRAVQRVAGFGFQHLGLGRIETVVLPFNQASLRTAEKSGARFEGLARQRLWTSNEAQDAVVYALVPHDLF